MKHRERLIIDNIDSINPNFRDILLLDPKPFYDLIEHKIKPFQRHQLISIIELFPNKDDKTCACGCGVKLKGRQTRWASKDCQKLPLQILYVLKGDSQFITNILYSVYGYKCSVCGKSNMEVYRPNKNDMRCSIELEHTLAIKNGGGGSWLGNYTFHCINCHREKTNKDFGWKSKQQ